MNRWVYKLEYKYKKYSIPNLMLYITGTMLVVFGMELILGYPVELFLDLSRREILSGQIWRLITFVFVPMSSSVVTSLIYMYFMYSIGSTLENVWGSFRFTLFYICGMIATILAMFITGYGTSYYLNLTVFLAYAYYFPNQEFLLFFILPIKAKYLAYVDLILLIMSFVTAGWIGRIGILFAMINFVLFFGTNLFKNIGYEFKNLIRRIGR